MREIQILFGEPKRPKKRERLEQKAVRKLNRKTRELNRQIKKYKSPSNVARRLERSSSKAPWDPFVFSGDGSGDGDFWGPGGSHDPDPFDPWGKKSLWCLNDENN